MALRPRGGRELIFPRKKEGTTDASQAVSTARTSLTLLKGRSSELRSSLAELKMEYSRDCYTYYTLAAVSRRKNLSPDLRAEALSLLFPLRTAIEKLFFQGMMQVEDSKSLLKVAASTSFFGVSAKQGVSIRYPLCTCVPTSQCGGRCYAHDGRDRELHHLVRGCLNYFLGHSFENGGSQQRHAIMKLLDASIRNASTHALCEQERSRAQGFDRPPRIRFSHIGEMSSTPAFTNALAKRIKSHNPSLLCVIYTRHPEASKLDPELFIVNFTVEGASDPRRKFAPEMARLVNSAWDGELVEDVDVNFIEHHVQAHSTQSGNGMVCPVTAHPAITSCDEAHCTVCFQPPVHPGSLQIGTSRLSKTNGCERTS